MNINTAIHNRLVEQSRELALIEPMDPRIAFARWAAFRVENGWGPKAPLLSPQEANSKFDKDHRVATVGLSLAQADTCNDSDIWRKYNLPRISFCPFSTPGCRAGCVAKNGNGAFDRTQQARILKNAFLLVDPLAFLTLLAWEIDKAYAKHGDSLRIRLNTFSDVSWEQVAPWLFTGRRSAIRFYDYSKVWTRSTPANYALTLSVSERTSNAKARAAALAGQSVAVVFTTKRTDPLPATWAGLTVVDGDKSDNRTDDPAGSVVGLRAKGRMRKDTTGFVRSA